MRAPVTEEEASAVTVDKMVAVALQEALTMVDSIDFIANHLGRVDYESHVAAEAIKACSARIRAFAEPFMPQIEAHAVTPHS